ncbi:DegT/DnrJ/EryC1/StrS family aminotransferase [Aurantivibrio infirmus]
MNFSMLPPVGNRIALFGEGVLPEFASYSPVWLDSGTSALALALILIRERSKDISNPQVLVPAYGCPDLIAAAIYAKVQPVLVDICPDDPCFNLEDLKSKITHQTIAVLAVNFLGIRERLNEIRAMLPSYTYLLEDNAQWYPEPNEQCLYGDFVITSFGRGKPASILGGGLLLIKNDLNCQETDYSEYVEASKDEGFNTPISMIFKVLIYNTLLIPFIYYWLLKIPFLHIGATVFKPLSKITKMPSWRKRLLGINLRRYFQFSSNDVTEQYEKLFSSAPDFDIIAGDMDGRNVKKLRYPILCRDGKSRDIFFEKFQELGLGVTKMYQVPLLEIEGVKEVAVASQSYVNAATFAQRLITFPVHTGVSIRYINRLSKFIEKFNK